jgi:tRNA A-37 threonylcarbamoyl transferase component Bud32
MWHILDPSFPEPFRSLKSVMQLEGELVTKAKNREVIKFTHAGKTYYIKRYTSAGKGIRAHLGRSRVRAEWENLQFFWHLKIPSPKLIAYGEERTLINGYVAGAYVMQALPHVVPLNSIEQYPALIQDQAWRFPVITQIAHAVKTLHAEGFAHGDLYWRNILLSLEDKPTVYFIDCPMGKFYFGPKLSYQMIRDLACLAKDTHRYFSRTDLLRFFLMYRGHDHLTREDKIMLQRILLRLQPAQAA